MTNLYPLLGAHLPKQTPLAAAQRGGSSEFGRFDEPHDSILEQGGVRGFPQRRHHGCVRERAESAATQDLESDLDLMPFRAKKFPQR